MKPAAPVTITRIAWRVAARIEGVDPGVPDEVGTVRVRDDRRVLPVGERPHLSPGTRIERRTCGA